MLKIWGRRNSVNVQKVLWTADELGVRYEQVDVGGPFGGNREPWYLALNPNALIPTIQDGDLVLWESNAIVRYLAARHGTGRFWAPDPGERSLADRWMDWQTTTLAPGMGSLFWGWVRTPAEKRDPEALEKARVATAEVWGRLDRHLEGRAFVAGETFTMGDIPAGSMLHRWYHLPIERPETPHLRAWYDRLATRPAYRQHVMVPLS